MPVALPRLRSETGSAATGRPTPRAVVRRRLPGALRRLRTPLRSGRGAGTRASEPRPTHSGVANRASARAYLQARVSLARSPVGPYTSRPGNSNSMQRLMTRAWVEIDLGALVRNGDRFARAAGVPLLPMVKADAYGLGAVRVAHALLPPEPWAYGVATVEEGEELRGGGISRPILVFSPLLPDQFDAVRRATLRPVLGDRVAIERWTGAREAGGDEDPWHLAIDTGMSRAGVPWREIASVRELVAALPS